MFPRRLILCLLLGFVDGEAVAAFQASAPPSTKAFTRDLLYPRNFASVLAAREEASDEDAEGYGDGAALSPMQVRFLRKETDKRRTRRKLRRFSLPEAESSGLFADESLEAIASILAADELVEVRGISRGNKKNAFDVGEDLALALSSEIGRDSFVIDRKGFVAVVYCPGDEKLDGKIRLRTSIGQKNIWQKRPKAPRDNRGQIIAEKS